MIVALALTTFSLCTAHAQGRRVSRSEMRSLVREFRSREDFTGMSFGRMAVSIARGVVKMEMRKGDLDEEERRMMEVVLDMMKEVTGVTVAEYEDCSSDVRYRFNRRLAKVLQGVELLLSVSNEGERVYIYGYVSPDGRWAEDLVISVPDSGALVCVYGRMDMSHLGELTKMMS